MSIKVQEAPQAPSYAAANIQVPANIATPQSTMEGVKAQQGQLNAVNNLSGGRHRTSTTKRQKRQRSYKHKSFIRTYKGRRYQQQQQPQQGGAGERIPVPQVGTTCSSGPQCMGSQNANLTALNNQATSNSINDAYAQSGGSRHKKVRFSHTKRHRNTKQRHDHSFTSTIAYNIKKVLRKVFA